MGVKERIKRKEVTGVKYSVSEQGLHIQLNGYKEFVISKPTLMLLNGKVFEGEIKKKEDENIIDTPKS